MVDFTFSNSQSRDSPLVEYKGPHSRPSDMGRQCEGFWGMEVLSGGGSTRWAARGMGKITITGTWEHSHRSQMVSAIIIIIIYYA